jgi:hypothetical protein
MKELSLAGITIPALILRYLKSLLPISISLKQLLILGQLLKTLKDGKHNQESLEANALNIQVPPRPLPAIPYEQFMNSGSDSKPEKPWLPATECQFKYCHSCKPFFRERCYLSLDAIALGEYPATALTGFGFHYYGQRPIAPAELVRNIGSRPNPSYHPVRQLLPRS